MKFALGRHAEHVEALERIKDLVDEVADPPRRAAWYYWTGFLQSLIGGAPEEPIRYCREALAIADAAGFDDIRPFAECCLAHVLMAAGDLAAGLETASARSGPSRSGAIPGGPAGRSGRSARSRTISASGSAASVTAAAPSSTARP